jgi:hypothetical protein
MNLGASEELASESENVMSTGSIAVPPMLLIRPRVLLRPRRRLTFKNPTIHGRLNLAAPRRTQEIQGASLDASRRKRS